MILAAGRGERMRPLTDTCPKPLLKVAGMPLIEHHVRRLVAAGIDNIVINTAWLGEQISDYLQDGHRFGAKIEYSNEGANALETAGGIIKALPLLTASSAQPFLVVNGDIYCEFDFSLLPVLSETQLAHIYLVDNPEHNKSGDFFLDEERVVNALPSSVGKFCKSLTFSGIGLYRPAFFNIDNTSEVLPLAPLLRKAADRQQLFATALHCRWVDVGTPERLTQLNNELTKDTL